ncbi:MAG: diguanylate cyclase [Neorhizobium sp.]|nr:diguanylate cyclase [Neorhizobium sp.]
MVDTFILGNEQIPPANLLERLCKRLLTAADESREDADPGMIGDGMMGDGVDLALLLDQLPDALYIKDRASRFIFANASTGRGRSPFFGAALIGKTDFDVLDEKAAALCYLSEQHVMESGAAIEAREEKVVFLDGKELWLSTSKMPLRSTDGTIVGLIGLSRDISERKRREELRHGHARLLEMIARGQPLQPVLDALVRLAEAELDGIRMSILTLDPSGGRLRNAASSSLSPAFMEMVDGIEVGPSVGSCGTAAWRRSAVIVSDVTTDPLWSDYRGIGQAGGFRGCWSIPILGTGGRLLGTLGFYSVEPREPTEDELELAGMVTDIAGIAIERAEVESRIRFMAHHDPLTGLPNRALFWSQFNDLLRDAAAAHAMETDNADGQGHREIAVAYIDLDNFKQVNDTLGHAAGDEVLMTLAKRMAGCIGAGDLLVRLGGDEFAVVLADDKQPSLDCSGEAMSARTVIGRLECLRAAIAEPLAVAGRAVTATCSMGVAFYPADGTDPDALLAKADRAMYGAKECGRDALHVAAATGI